MINDDSSRNMHYPPARKPIPPKSQVYSPSTSYNYNGTQTAHGNHGNPNYGSQQHLRRKPNQFKRDNHGATDRLAKQNDIIIRLLKEIRDRLPPPPVVAGENNEALEQLEDTMNLQHETSLDNESVPEVASSEEEGVVQVAGENDDDEMEDEVNGNM